MNDALVQRLEERSMQLTSRVLAEMYQNPFWMERFGERGRTNSEKDGNYHLSYLKQALIASDPGIMTGYARWLQSLLVNRGMCTAHIAENFARLEHAIADEISDAQPAVDLLRAARDALVYAGGPARELQDLSAGMADAAVAALYRPLPGQDARAEDTGRKRCHEDMLYHLTYLADAIALGRGELFVSYVAWISGFLGRRNVPPSHLRLALQWIEQHLAQEAHASEALRVVAGSALDQALQQLAAADDRSSSGASSPGSMQ